MDINHLLAGLPVGGAIETILWSVVFLSNDVIVSIDQLDKDGKVNLDGCFDLPEQGQTQGTARRKGLIEMVAGQPDLLVEIHVEGLNCCAWNGVGLHLDPFPTAKESA